MKFIKIILKAFSLDLYFINLAYGWERLDILSLPKDSLPKPGILRQIIKFLWRGVSSIRYFSGFKTKKDMSGKPLFFFESYNQLGSIKEVSKKTKNAILINLASPKVLHEKNSEIFPMAIANFISAFFFPLVIFKYFISEGYKKRGFKYSLDHYLRIYGYYIVARLWFYWSKPSSIILANDHNAIPRAILQAGKDENIPTIYIQHASVTEKFHPLDFKYAFLDGMDALEKYNNAGKSKTKVFLIGMSKADKSYKYINTKTKANSIGICMSMLDPLIRGEQLCMKIRERFPDFELFLRPHPSDNKINLWKNIAFKYSINFSLPKDESSFEFLNKIDVAIASDSGILLEAALVNVYPIYFDFREVHLDHYGFEKNGLVERYISINQLLIKLDTLAKEKSNIRFKTKYYCASVDSLYDGKSSDLAAKLINEITECSYINLLPFKKIPNIKLEAYDLEF